MTGSDEMVDFLLLSLEFGLQFFLLSFQLLHLFGQDRVRIENGQFFLVLQKLLNDLGTDDGGLELLQPFAVELLLDLGPFPLLALAIAFFRFLVETLLFDLVGLAALFFQSLLLLALALGVCRLQHLLPVFDDLTALENLGVLRARGLLVKMQKLPTELVEGMNLALRIDLE